MQHIMAAKQFKAVAVNTEQAVLLHLAQLVGQRTAVDIQIIRKLLTVKRDGEAAAAAARRLK